MEDFFSALCINLRSIAVDLVIRYSSGLANYDEMTAPGKPPHSSLCEIVGQHSRLQRLLLKKSTTSSYGYTHYMTHTRHSFHTSLCVQQHSSISSTSANLEYPLGQHFLIAPRSFTTRWISYHCPSSIPFRPAINTHAT
jgi:hypothetical protein